MVSSGFLLRSAVVFLTFVGIGILTDRAITAYAMAHGSAEINVRMAAAMAGLFAGGVAACVLGIALFLMRPRNPNP